MDAIKRQCPANSEMRRLLCVRRIVVELHFRWEGPKDVWSREMARIENKPIEDIDEKIYYHIGDASFSPTGASYKQLVLSPEQRVLTPGGVLLQVVSCN